MSPLVLLGLSVWTLLNVIAGSVILALQLRLEVSEGCEEVDWRSTPKVFWQVTLGYLCILITALSCAAYLYVSSRAPRPWEFHGYGVLLLLMLPNYLFQELQGHLRCVDLYRGRLGVLLLIRTMDTLRHLLFFELLLRKVRVLTPSSQRCECRHPTLWTRWFQVSMIVGLMFGSYPYAIRGMVDFDAWKNRIRESSNRWAGAPKAVRLPLNFLESASVLSVVFFMVGLSFTTWLSIRSVLRKLTERNAAVEDVARLRRILRRHFWGVMAAVTTKVLLWLALSFATPFERMVALPFGVAQSSRAWGYLVDCAGDIAGIFLLSGLGTLLFREDPDMGDVARLFRSLVHSAVLTSRGEHVFEGKVMVTRTRRCIVSFPGRFLAEWYSLTWLCEQGELSSACVFLPVTDPHGRYGKHVENPDDGNRCWCHSIYGSVKPWGCMWFDAWMKNIQEAVRLRLDLVVVYFPGEAGQGEVAWADLTTVNLWDGVGLGGSQKAEVAFLEKAGITFIREDVEAFRLKTRPS